MRESLRQVERAGRSEKAKVPEDGGLINQALIGLKPVNTCGHTYTKPQTPSTRSRGLGWRIHESVEDTKLSTNKQHTLSCLPACFGLHDPIIDIGYPLPCNVGVARDALHCTEQSCAVDCTRAVG